MLGIIRGEKTHLIFKGPVQKFGFKQERGHDEIRVKKDESSCHVEPTVGQTCKQGGGCIDTGEGGLACSREEAEVDGGGGGLGGG